MSNLAALGVSEQRRYLSSDGDETSAERAELTEMVFTLPRSIQIEASFAREGLGDKLLKIFKGEIQTGDALFDEHVHITTDTTDATAKLLESIDLRAVIESLVVDGAAIEIDGATVKVELPGRHDGADAATENLVRVLVG